MACRDGMLGGYGAGQSQADRGRVRLGVPPSPWRPADEVTQRARPRGRAFTWSPPQKLYSRGRGERHSFVEPGEVGGQVSCFILPNQLGRRARRLIERGWWAVERISVKVVA